jgi:lysophospholipase L1-like esterase
MTTIVSFGLAEWYLRIAYADGMSFSSRTGPLVRRFEQGFQFNRFDGPSRGPEVVGPKGEGRVRVLIQGDSITWGQGVKDESLLYSSLLSDRLRSVNPGIEVAVLAQPGREIDGHLAQLNKWGDEIAPDIIIYQWFINDLELDKSQRPDIVPGWQKLLFPSFLTNRSYLWYLLNYRLETWLYPLPYEGHMRERYSPGTEGWRLFAEQFHAWTTEARRLTPHVLVALYPFLRPSQDAPLPEFHAWMRELSDKEGVASIDLLEPLDVFRDDFTKTFASPFDSHPGVAAQERVAEALDDRLLELWPELLNPAPDDGLVAARSV